MKIDDEFDFGFTAVNEDELDSVIESAGKDDTIQSLQAKLDRLYSSIVPLITNLKKNTEKDYIYWPNRLQKIEAFESNLKKIYNGK